MKLRFLLICFLLQTAPSYAQTFLKRTLTQIVIDGQTGRTLEAKGADVVCHPASLTKMMTLYLTFEALKNGKITMNTNFTTSQHASRQMNTKLGLRPGERMPVRQLVLAVAVKSANDAAVVLAEGLAGSENAFATRMNEKAQELGMKSTVFKNAAGVPHPRQITTARDMATLSRALYRNFPYYYYLFKTKQISLKGRVYRNTNKLLGQFSGMDGLKTGYTFASGYNLAASAQRINKFGKQTRLIAVVLGGNSSAHRNKVMSALLERNFQRVGSSTSAKIYPINEEPSLETPFTAAPSKNSMDLIIDEAVNSNQKIKSTDQKVVKHILQSLNPPLVPKSKPKAVPKKKFIEGSNELMIAADSKATAKKTGKKNSQKKSLIKKAQAKVKKLTSKNIKKKEKELSQ